MDPTTVVTMLASAIAALFGAYALAQNMRIKRLEEELDKKDALIETKTATIDRLQEERLADAKDASMLAKAYMSLREQEVGR